MKSQEVEPWVAIYKFSNEGKSQEVYFMKDGSNVITQLTGHKMPWRTVVIYDLAQKRVDQLQISGSTNICVKFEHSFDDFYDCGDGSVDIIPPESGSVGKAYIRDADGNVLTDIDFTTDRENIHSLGIFHPELKYLPTLVKNSDGKAWDLIKTVDDPHAIQEITNDLRVEGFRIIDQTEVEEIAPMMSGMSLQDLKELLKGQIQQKKN